MSNPGQHSGQTPEPRLARTWETQCFSTKFFGRGKGRWRCQFEDDHPGNHRDDLGREWKQRHRYRWRCL